MADPSSSLLRIWEGFRSAVARPAEPICSNAPPVGDSLLTAAASVLAQQEILRALPQTDDPVEPLSLQWYRELEHLRHHRQGRWIPSLLEFGKHAGERLLGLGVGLGSDLVQYALQGAEVVSACPSTEQLSLVRRNFELRGLRATFVHAKASALPLDSASIDVACLIGLVHEAADPGSILDEVYRILKPGGKVLAVVPARYDIDYWRRWFYMDSPPAMRCGALPAAPSAGHLLSPSARRFHGRELKQLFHRFHEPRLYKRHLRRAETPHLWRRLPIGLLERMMGRLLVFKGFKPVSAAIGEQAAA